MSICCTWSDPGRLSAISAGGGAVGRVHAVVGDGENKLNYAVNLWTVADHPHAAAESRIRDAGLASEAAAIAALAQANSAAQAVLQLLRA